MQAILLSLVPIIFFNLFTLVPESPAFLLKSNKKELAERSMEFYGKLEGYPEADEFLSEKIDETSKQEDSPLSISDFGEFSVFFFFSEIQPEQ